MRSNEPSVLKSSDIYFNTPSNTAKNIFFYLICAGEFHCIPGYQVKRNNHHSFLLMFVHKGQGTVSFNDRIYSAKQNDLVLLNCHLPHEYATQVGWETLWVHFDGNFSPEFFNLIYNCFGCVIPLKPSSLIPGILREILTVYRSGKVLPEPLISCRIHHMLSELLILPDNVCCDMAEASPINAVVQFIETHYPQKITLPLLAAKANMSPFHFARRFKKEIGYAPYEYLLKTRIDQAKRLLKKTTMQVKAVAYEAGFSSESNFVFYFHKIVGLTPTQFRKMPF